MGMGRGQKKTSPPRSERTARATNQLFGYLGVVLKLAHPLILSVSLLFLYRPKIEKVVEILGLTSEVVLWLFGGSRNLL